MEYIVPEEHNPTLPYAPVGLHSVFGRNEASLNIPTQETQSEETTPSNLEQTTDIHESSLPAKRMTFRHAANVALSAALVLSTAASEEIPEPFRGSNYSHVIEPTRHFETTLADTTCDTPETPDLAAKYYRSVFETIDYASLSDEELTAAADTAIKELDAHREKLTFLELPKNYEELVIGLWSADQNIPLDDYKTALKDMLEPVGIEPLYEWDIPVETQDIPPALQIINPAQPKTPEEERTYKNILTGAIQSFATIPTNILKNNTNMTRVYFGDIVPEALGMATRLGDENVVLIDTGYEVHYVEAHSLTSHEITHTLQFNEWCKGGYDTAWANQFPKDFVLNSPVGTPESRFTTVFNLENYGENSKEIVAVNPYGSTKIPESNATLFGGSILNPTNTERLFEDIENSATINNQTGLQLSRTHTLDAEWARTLQWQLITAALEHETGRRATAAWNKAFIAESANMPPSVEAPTDKQEFLTQSEIDELYNQSNSLYVVFNELNKAQISQILVETGEKGGIVND